MSNPGILPKNFFYRICQVIWHGMVGIFSMLKCGEKSRWKIALFIKNRYRRSALTLGYKRFSRSAQLIFKSTSRRTAGPYTSSGMPQRVFGNLNDIMDIHFDHYIRRRWTELGGDADPDFWPIFTKMAIFVKFSNLWVIDLKIGVSKWCYGYAGYF